jgi:hypothetical protein
LLACRITNRNIAVAQLGTRAGFITDRADQCLIAGILNRGYA